MGPGDGIVNWPEYLLLAPFFLIDFDRSKQNMVSQFVPMGLDGMHLKSVSSCNNIPKRIFFIYTIMNDYFINLIS